MENTPLIAAINDISGYGRCGLTVAIPIISAMGLQVCPLPTAVLSAHTGYDNYQIVDFTPHIANFAANWKELNLKFKAIYTGFLGSDKQLEIVSKFIDDFASDDTIVLVDTIMADNGCVYHCFDEKMVLAIKKLSAKATVITPNLTEACILAQVDYDNLLTLSKDEFMKSVEQIGEKLQKNGPKQVVITGVCPDNDHMLNAIFDGEIPMNLVGFIKTNAHFSGTGDTFASLLCGYLANGKSLFEAVLKATQFISKVTQYTVNQKNNYCNGISFEPFLHELFE
ncbi:MAG: pyridoxamine kinase [Oscillospiraceae bacterium]